MYIEYWTGFFLMTAVWEPCNLEHKFISPINTHHSSQHPIDIESDALWTNIHWHHFDSEAQPKGKSPHFGAQVDHPWFHHFGSRHHKLFTLFSYNPLTRLIQAQFMISPDRTFLEMGAISRINYRDRFKQYKRLIIKNANTPRMSELVV